MNSMFKYASSFSRDIRNWNVSSVSDFTDIFLNATKMNGIYSALSTPSYPTADGDNFFYISMTNSNRQTAVDNWIDPDTRTYNEKLYGPITTRKTSLVTNMSSLFKDKTTFNEDISAWDTSNVTNMSRMFENASAFNQDISTWNTSSATNMGYMFYDATSFNKNIDSWNTQYLQTVTNMFNGATSFNYSISNWDTSLITDMSYMFNNATSFNSDVSFNSSSVTNMSSMFEGATSMNGTITFNDSSNLTNITNMFKNATSFNQDVSFNTANVTDMSGVFYNAIAFNKSINDWDTSKITNMSYVFYGASSYNQSMNQWNTSSVTDMTNMFNGATAFNSDITTWNTDSITSMNSMFKNASSFSYDLSMNTSKIYNTNNNYIAWNVNNITDFTDMFLGASGTSAYSSRTGYGTTPTGEYFNTLFTLNNLIITQGESILSKYPFVQGKFVLYLNGHQDEDASGSLTLPSNAVITDIFMVGGGAGASGFSGVMGYGYGQGQNGHYTTVEQFRGNGGEVKNIAPNNQNLTNLYSLQIGKRGEWNNVGNDTILINNNITYTAQGGILGSSTNQNEITDYRLDQ